MLHTARPNARPQSRPPTTHLPSVRWPLLFDPTRSNLLHSLSFSTTAQLLVASRCCSRCRRLTSTHDAAYPEARRAAHLASCPPKWPTPPRVSRCKHLWSHRHRVPTWHTRVRPRCSPLLSRCPPARFHDLSRQNANSRKGHPHSPKTVI